MSNYNSLKDIFFCCFRKSSTNIPSGTFNTSSTDFFNETSALLQNKYESEEEDYFDNLVVTESDFQNLKKKVQKCYKNRNRIKKKDYKFEKKDAIGFSELKNEVNKSFGLLQILYDEKKTKLNDTHLKYLKIVLYHLKKRKFFSMRFHTVLEKLISDCTFDLLNETSVKEYEDLAEALSIKKKFVKEYLTVENPPEKLRVFIVITESFFSARERLFRKEKLTLSNKFGMFHCSVVVGSWYLQWLSNALIIPKRLQTKNAICSFDATAVSESKKFTNEFDFQKVQDIVAQMVIKWNTELTYSLTTRNCQHFVFELMRELGIPIYLKRNGALKNFFDKILLKGKNEISFIPSEYFIKDFKLDEYKPIQKFRVKNGYKIKFNTHKELDTFWVYCKKNPLEISKYSEDRALLKSFDRAFWLRFFKIPVDEREYDLNYSPLREVRIDEKDINITHVKCLCPWGNPTKTGSFLDQM